jgi:hypothetical protein
MWANPSAAQIERIRELVVATLADLGMADDNWSLVTETIMLHDRNYAGRKFGLEGVRAVWLADENVVKFYDDDGKLLTMVAIQNPLSGGQNAA